MHISVSNSICDHGKHRNAKRHNCWLIFCQRAKQQLHPKSYDLAKHNSL